MASSITAHGSFQVPNQENLPPDSTNKLSTAASAAEPIAIATATATATATEAIPTTARPEPANDTRPRPKMKRSGGGMGPFPPGALPMPRRKSSMSASPVKAPTPTPTTRPETKIQLPAYATGPSAPTPAKVGGMAQRFKLSDTPGIALAQQMWDQLQGRPPKPITIPAQTNSNNAYQRDDSPAGPSDATDLSAAESDPDRRRPKPITMASSKRPYTLYYEEEKTVVTHPDWLIPKHYRANGTFPGHPWICPVRDCQKCFASSERLAGHFAGADHAGAQLNDNRDGTFSVVHLDRERGGPPIVVAQKKPKKAVPKAEPSLASEPDQVGSEEKREASLESEVEWDADEPTRIADQVVIGDISDDEDFEADDAETADVRGDITVGREVKQGLDNTPSGRPYMTYQSRSTRGCPIPDFYTMDNTNPQYPWICPLRSCRKIFRHMNNLGSHFVAAHRARYLNDNGDGTLSDRGTYNEFATNSQRLRSIIISQLPLDPSEPPMATPSLPANISYHSKYADAARDPASAAPRARRVPAAAPAPATTPRQTPQRAVVKRDPSPFIHGLTAAELGGDPAALWAYMKPHLHPPTFQTEAPPGDGYLSMLLILPKVRDVDWNTALLDEFPFQITRPRDLDSLAVHLTGEEQAEPCDRCRYGRGPYKGCVLISTRAHLTARLAIHGCACCYYHGRQKDCSLKMEGRDGALRDVPARVYQELDMDGCPQAQDVDDVTLSRIKRKVALGSGAVVGAYNAFVGTPSSLLPSSLRKDFSQKEYSQKEASQRESSQGQYSQKEFSHKNSLKKAKPPPPPPPTRSLIGTAKDNWDYVQAHINSNPEHDGCFFPPEKYTFLPEVLALERRRAIEFNPARRGNFKPKPDFDIVATALQVTGSPAPAPCDKCAAGYGPFVGCVVLPQSASENARRTLTGCANCMYKHSQANCSMYVKQSGRLAAVVTMEDISVPRAAAGDGDGDDDDAMAAPASPTAALPAQNNNNNNNNNNKNKNKNKDNNNKNNNNKNNNNNKKRKWDDEGGGGGDSDAANARSSKTSRPKRMPARYEESVRKHRGYSPAHKRALGIEVDGPGVDGATKDGGGEFGGGMGGGAAGAGAARMMPNNHGIVMDVDDSDDEDFVPSQSLKTTSAAAVPKARERERETRYGSSAVGSSSHVSPPSPPVSASASDLVSGGPPAHGAAVNVPRMANWELAPGRVGSFFSAPYVRSAGALPVGDTGVFQVLTLLPGEMRRLPADFEHVRLCVVSREGQLNIRIDGEDPRALSADGAFRLRPGRAATVTNVLRGMNTMYVFSVDV